MEAGLLKLAELGLRVAGRYGFALAGGFAVQAHGILDRPSEDIDLFTAWERRGEFAAAVDAVIDTHRAHGYAVDVTQRSPHRPGLAHCRWWTASTYRAETGTFRRPRDAGYAA
jgi:hypothetical protein